MRLAAVLVLLYLGTMIIMFRSDLKAVFEPPLLLPIMNTIFAGLIPIAVSVIAARTYLYSGLSSFLFMGCGMITFGCGAVLAGWLPATVTGDESALARQFQIILLNGYFTLKWICFLPK